MRISRADYAAPRISWLAPEGPARLSGQVLRGDYLLAFDGADMRSKSLGESLQTIHNAPAEVSSLTPSEFRIPFGDSKLECR